MNEEKTQVSVTTTTGGWGMTPTDPTQAYKMAEYISGSGMCPSDYQGNPAKIMVCAAMGSRLGMDVFQAMAGICVIHGRPSIWGDALRALVLSHPALMNIIEKYEGEGDTLTAVCIITRRGLSAYEATFSVADAKKAGLWGRGVWQKFSKDMLANRAFGRAARRRFADALNGMHVAEEMQDADVSEPVKKGARQQAEELTEKAKRFTIEREERSVPENTIEIETVTERTQDNGYQLPAHMEIEESNTFTDAEILEMDNQ